MITIIDYGLGNISAFVNLYERLNIRTKIARTSEDLDGAEKIILPGVGAFDYAIERLNKSGMREKLDELVQIKKIPVLGICVGMQIMAESGEEGKLPGLAWIEGHVKLFDTTQIPYKTRLPHMGWNSVTPVNGNRLMADFNENTRFYFLHSYYFNATHQKEVISTTEYGISFASAVNKENIYGIQFHPEKSHSNGIQLLKNFALLS